MCGDSAAIHIISLAYDLIHLHVSGDQLAGTEVSQIQVYRTVPYTRLFAASIQPSPHDFRIGALDCIVYSFRI